MVHETETLFIVLFSGVMILTASAAFAAVADFDGLALDSDSHYGGAGSGATGFTDGDAWFSHNDSSYAWDGFVYSNVNDTTTAGFTNQFAAITGTDVSGSGNYGVSYVPLDYTGSYAPVPQVISFGAVTGEDYNTTISGMYVTNTTYAYLSMTQSDGFGKKFGGDKGHDPDWFLLTVKGITESGYTANTVEFYLADFRFEDDTLDYIVDEWTWMDLSGLGNVVGLEFSLSSSDSGMYGMNTPGYFAFDNLNGAPVPVPGAIWLFGAGLISLVGLVRGRR